MALTGRYVWRDFVSDGIPSSGKHKPTKAEIRAWGTALEEALALTAQTLSASVARATFAELNAVVGDYANGDIGLVVLDDDLDLRGVYQKESGVWVKKAELPNEAAQIAEQAALAAQAAQAAAEAAAAGVDLPPIAPNRMLVDNSAGTLRESKTFNEVRQLLSPLRNFAADGVTDDTANFSALRSAWPSEEFDLLRKTYLVDSIPSGPFANGEFLINDYEPGVDVLVPTKDMFPKALTCLSAGNRYAAWPQHKWHMWDGVIYAFWMEGNQHSTADTDKYIVCMRSKDGGNSWIQKERLTFGASGEGVASFAAGVADGEQFIIVRYDTSLTYKLFSRRLPQRYELTNCIDTTSGSPEFDIDFADAGVTIGALEGRTAEFRSTGTTAGVNIDGARPVSFVNGLRIQFTAGSNFNATLSNVGGTGAGNNGNVYFSLSFQESAWTEIPLGGSQIGTRLKFIWDGLAGTMGSHGFAAQPGAHIGSFYVGVAGSTIDVGVAKINNPFDSLGTATRDVAWVRQIAVTADHSEPCIWVRPSDGKIFGTCRTQSFSNGAMFFMSANELATAPTISQFPAGAFVQSPMPIVEAGGKLWIAASGARTGPALPGTGKFKVPFYLLSASIADVEANGASAFKIRLIHELEFSDHFFGAANAVGVPSLLAIDENTLMIGLSTDVAPGNVLMGPAHVYALKVDIGNLAKRGNSLIQPGQVAELDDFYCFYRGLGAVSNNGYLNFSTEVRKTVPASFDTSAGYFTAPEPGLYLIDGTVAYAAGTVGERYCQVVDSTDANVMGGLLIGMAYAAGASDETYGTFSVPYEMRQGERVRLKVTSPGGTKNSNVRSYLSVRKL